jgi:TolB-like protein
MSGDPEQEYFSDGITEDIITDLSRVSALFVVARNSSFTYKGRSVKIQEVCADLGVRYVLEGSVRKAGNKVRITGQLIDGSTGGHVWADRYDGTLEDIFELQDQVTCQIVDALKLKLLPEEEQSIHNVPTSSVEAYNAFLLGRHALSIESEQGYADAIGHFQQSVALDPGFARAHYCLYLAAYLKRRVFGEDMALLEIARAAAGHARNLGFRPAVPWVHIERRLDKDKLPGTRNLAREALDKIRDFDPEWGSFGYEQMTWVLSAAGFFTATLEFAKHMFDATGGNYEDSDANEELPNHYAAVGQIDEAIRLWSVEIQKDPLRPGFRLERAILYARTGQFNHAEADIDVLESGKYQYLAKAAYHFHRGEMEKLKEYHNRLVAIKKLHPGNLVYTFLMLEDYSAATKQIDKSTDSSSSSFIDFGYLRVSMRATTPIPLVNELENHPDFRALLAREGITDQWRAELAQWVNELTKVTGIRIQPSDDQQPAGESG